MIVLRQATQQDAKTIRNLIWRVGINPMSLHWQRFIVAVDDQDQVIGCGQIKLHGDGSRELASIAVQPEWQGQGIGKSIIEWLLGENNLPLYLTCRAEMEPYYQKFGFRAIDTGEMTPYFRRLYAIAKAFSRLSPHMGQMRVMLKQA